MSIDSQNATSTVSRSTEFDYELHDLGILLVLREQIFARSNHWVRLTLPNGTVACFLPADAFEVPLVENAQIMLCDLTGPGLAYDVTVAGEQIRNAAWRLLSPAPRFKALRGYVGVDPTRIDDIVAEGFGRLHKGVRARPR